MKTCIEDFPLKYTKILAVTRLEKDSNTFRFYRYDLQSGDISEITNLIADELQLTIIDGCIKDITKGTDIFKVGERILKDFAKTIGYEGDVFWARYPEFL